MKKTALFILGFAAAFCFGFLVKPSARSYPDLSLPSDGIENLKLGAFSVSLSVKDLRASKAFYENLGFTHFAGSMEQNYLIMKNESTVIGLFQGMFEGNILTFNPGWDENAAAIDSFDDIRVIQKHLKSKGVALVSEADESTSGPASLMVKDPDGNLILLDQHR